MFSIQTMDQMTMCCIKCVTCDHKPTNNDHLRAVSLQLYGAFLACFSSLFWFCGHNCQRNWQAGFSWCMWTVCRVVGPCCGEHLSVCCVSVLLVVASESPADASKWTNQPLRCVTVMRGYISGEVPVRLHAPTERLHCRYVLILHRSINEAWHCWRSFT